MKHNNILLFGALISILFFLNGCAAGPMKGVSANGSKVLLGNDSIEESAAYMAYLKTPGSEQDKLNYLNERLKSAQDVIFYMDGERYTWRDAFEGGSWLLRKKYEKGQSAKEFLKEHIWYAENSRKPNLLEYPSGEVHVGYYVFLNELELLEQTVIRQN